MTDKLPAIPIPDAHLDLHLAVTLPSWRLARRQAALRAEKWRQGQLCLFQPAPRTLTDSDVEVWSGRPRQS